MKAQTGFIGAGVAVVGGILGTAMGPALSVAFGFLAKETLLQDSRMTHVLAGPTRCFVIGL